MKMGGYMNQSLSFAKHAFLLLITSLLFLNTALKTEAASQGEISRLKKGEVLSRSLTSELKGNLRGAEAKIFIKAPPEKVWEVINDQEKLPEFVSRFKKVKVIEKTPNQQKVQVAIKVCPFLPLFNYTLVFDTTEKNRQIKFNKVAGAFSKLFGACDLEPYGNGTILKYRIYLDPGFYIPEFVRTGSVNKDLPEVLKSIRNKVENS